MSFSAAIYQAAVAMEGRERERFLEWVFRNDPDGMARMLRLLEKAGESSAFFMDVGQHRGIIAGEILGQEPVVGTQEVNDGEAEKSAMWIGSYRITGRIGEGASSVVYEGKQQDPVRRLVAIKIIRAGMDTESVIARFELERQALALMSHPNIAHIFDAGATVDGRPYFVMERVSGEKITTCCDRERLDVESRVRLFILVCHAIQHAHQKGVIHRDIKPSNVLVTFPDGVPVPKVIDFGIAKAADFSGGPLHWTTHDQIIGTPPYMSPEQVDMSGIDVDTRSDIYSLGALLYELLCGQAPFDGELLRKVGISEMRRMLLRQEPPLPSRVLADLPTDKRGEIASLRREEPARLISRLRGDLDWIVAKAMAKDRTRRYETVNALAADLERLLAHQPTVARRPSSLYLVGKFIRRNRVLCAAGVAMTLMLLGGLTISTWLYLNKRAALLEQQRLSLAVEAANRREIHLRSQTQARANVSRVAVLVSEGKITEADELLRQIPLESIEPSREAAEVFRSLGNWYAMYGKWKQAVQCFTLLNQANLLDDPVKIVEETDLLAIAPALIESGDKTTYNKFRQEILDRYLPVKNSLQAEHILKVCLLEPADAATMERLREVAAVCARVVLLDPDHPNFPSWEAFAMTLYYSRLGNTSQTLVWGGRCLSFEDPTGARDSSVLSLLALAKYRAGDRQDAVKDMEQARQLIPENLLPERPPDARGNAGRGTWYSWAVAKILLRETEKEMGR
jgi:serine/threonine protein kinase